MSRANISTIHNNYQQHLIDLAAVFRIVARLNMHESVANHFSFAVTEKGDQFLINPMVGTFQVLKPVNCCC